MREVRAFCTAWLAWESVSSLFVLPCRPASIVVSTRSGRSANSLWWKKETDDDNRSTWNSPTWTRGRPTKGAPDERNVKQGEREKKDMKHRASFAWKRLRRLEIGHLTAAPRYSAVDWHSEGYLYCPPFGAEWVNRTIGYLTDGFWQQLPCAIVWCISACMHDAVTLQRAMYRGGRASEQESSLARRA